MRAIIVDIDGTLADCRHRLHYVLPGGKRDWDAFFAAMHLDTCIVPVRDLVNFARAADLLSGDEVVDVVLSSGRPESHRGVTEQWLRDNSVGYDALYMRPDGDTRADHIVKREMLDRIRADGYEPFIVIDDREQVVRAWREAGLVCLQAAPDIAPIPSSAVLTLMVGPSGGGKSHWLRHEIAGIGEPPTLTDPCVRERHIISSDEIRQDLCGDFRDQSRNTEVFAAVHAIALARLRSGLPVVIDATHLRRKDRMSAAQLVPATNKVRYIVVDRSMEAKRRDAGWRSTLDVDLLAKHQATFGSQIKDILRGDNLPNVEVYDLRSEDCK